jgi:AcrR family transcriptional regulator
MTTAAKPATRPQDPEGVRRNILEVASRAFAEHGYSGARVDEIAARTDTSKRMIYYYFKDKEGLFVAALEAAYATMRQVERELNLTGLGPAEALRRLTEFTFDYQNGHPWFVRLIIVENIHNGEHLAKSAEIQKLNLSIIEMLRDVYDRGVREGDFRPGLDIIDLHMTISALAIFNVSHRATFSQIFRVAMDTPEALARRRAVAADTVLRYVLRKPDPSA